MALVHWNKVGLIQVGHIYHLALLFDGRELLPVHSLLMPVFYGIYAPSLFISFIWFKWVKKRSCGAQGELCETSLSEAAVHKCQGLPRKGPTYSVILWLGRSLGHWEGPVGVSWVFFINVFQERQFQLFTKFIRDARRLKWKLENGKRKHLPILTDTGNVAA